MAGIDQAGTGSNEGIREYYQQLKADGKFDQKDLEKLSQRIASDSNVDPEEQQVLKDVASTPKFDQFKLKSLPPEVKSRFDQIRADATDPANLKRLEGNMQKAIDGTQAETRYNGTPTGIADRKETFPELYGEGVTPQRRAHVLETYTRVAAANGWTSPGQMKDHLYEVAFLATVVDAMEKSAAAPGAYNADGTLDRAAVRQYYDQHQNNIMPSGDPNLIHAHTLKQQAHYNGAYAGAEQINYSDKRDGSGQHLSVEVVDHYTDDENYGFEKHNMLRTVDLGNERYDPGHGHGYTPYQGEILDSDGMRDELEGGMRTGRQVNIPIHFPVKW